MLIQGPDLTTRHRVTDNHDCDLHFRLADRRRRTDAVISEPGPANTDWAKSGANIGRNVSPGVPARFPAY